jgi:ABC-type nickel/cobalt efflux system permease component RcnA
MTQFSPRRLIVLVATLALSGSALFAGQKQDWEIRVSVPEQKVTVSRDGVAVREMLCSTGIPGTDDATPAGDYVLNESGTKRGKWFYSAKYGEGAKYWVGFIGGTYLFHSVPMDKNGVIIESEAKKLGTPASHGCVRLSLENAKWLYETVPDGAKVRIDDSGTGPTANSGPTANTGTITPNAATKREVSDWVDAHMAEYRQRHTLSCEIALIRLSLAIAGIRDLSEDEILASIPRGTDPETTFVCDDIDAGRKNRDGSVHWDNYGTHAPVVAKSINGYLASAGKSETWEARELVANDERLRALVSGDPDFRGAVVWLVGHPERWGAHPPVNERGMVLGEHVRFLEPTLDPDGKFRIRDPETGKLLETNQAGAARDLFGYRVVGLFVKGTGKGTVTGTSQSGGGAATPAGPSTTQAVKNGDNGGKVSRGAPNGQSRTGTMLSLAAIIKSFIAQKNDKRALVLLVLVALVYGVLHALGPGHQKTLVAGYLVSEGGGLGAAIAASGVASLSHALSVIGLFALHAILGTGFGVMDVEKTTTMVTLVSGSLLVILASIMVWKKVTALVAAIRGKADARETCACGHHHDGPCDEHGIVEDRHDCEKTPLAKRGAIPLLVSGSLAPCPGAALFLLFGFTAGNPLAGVVAVIAISLGMWLTLIAVGVASVTFRSAGLAGSRKRATWARYLPSLFGVCGSVAVLVFAVLMVIPAR